MSIYNLYLNREAFALNLDSEQVDVLDHGRFIVYGGEVYGSNGVNFYGKEVMIGVFGPLPTTKARINQEMIDRGERCPVCLVEPTIEGYFVELHHRPDCQHVVDSNAEGLVTIVDDPCPPKGIVRPAVTR
jgi:hypothetical protein